MLTIVPGSDNTFLHEGKLVKVGSFTNTQLLNSLLQKKHCKKSSLIDGETLLKTHTPSYDSNVRSGQTNYLGMVKEVRLGQSAAELQGNLEMSSTTNRLPRCRT